METPNQTTTCCQRCGRDYAQIYQMKVPTRGLRTSIGLLMIATIIIVFFMCVVNVASFSEDPLRQEQFAQGVSVIFWVFILAVVVTACIIKRARMAHVVYCPSCQSVYVIEGAPTLTKGWNMRKVGKELKRVGVTNTMTAF